MKAITICQPYAELIARGEKLIENRTWPTAYRGPLAIHAGKSRSWLDEDDERRYPGMVYGAVIAVVDLIGCRPISRLPPELVAHEHANGPICWILKNVRRIEPFPCRGRQGLWDVQLPREPPDEP